MMKFIVVFGATSQLSYVKAIGADSVILSPLVSRNTDCSKPGTVDFEQIDPRYGSQSHLTSFMAKAKRLDLKVVLSLPIQSVSSGSSWFGSSVTLAQEFEDWFLWRKTNDDKVNNQQESITWVQTDEEQWASVNDEAVLNLCSEGVQSIISAAQCQWLTMGFAGILYNPDFALNTTCSHRLVRKLSLDAISCARRANLETPVILIDTAYSPEKVLKFYDDGANTVISRALTSTRELSTRATAVAIQSSVIYGTSETTTTWTTSLPMENRISSRLSSELVDSFNLLTLMLPGSAVIEQGDELGSTDIVGSTPIHNSKCWPTNPMPKSSVFSWDDTRNSGFSIGEPWVPIASNARYANAKLEFSNPESHVGAVKLAAAIRKSPAFGEQTEIKNMDNVLAVLRWGSKGSLLLISNLENKPAEVLPSEFFGLPLEMSVATSSVGSRRQIATHVGLDKVMRLAPGEAVLLIGGPRHCGGPGPVDKIANKLAEGWQKINKYLGS